MGVLDETPIYTESRLSRSALADRDCLGSAGTHHPVFFARYRLVASVALDHRSRRSY